MTAIATGTFKSGQRLVELQLCELFGVKRAKIREAFRKLEHDGFVKITRNVGAVVGKFSRRDIEQMYDLLGVLDGTPALSHINFSNRAIPSIIFSRQL